MPEIKYLIMVVPGSNNYKYYKMIPNGDIFNVEYGRMGVDGFQKTSYPISKFNSVYNSKIKKGYEDKSELIKDVIEEDTSVSTDSKYAPIPEAAIAKIVQRLQDFANIAVKQNYTISANMVSKIMVEEAQTNLNKLVYEKNTDKFNEILLELFKVIPRKMNKVSSFLAQSKDDFSDIISKEQSLLDIMEGQVKQYEKEKEQKELQTKQKVTKTKVAPSKTILEDVGLIVEETTEAEKKHIKEMLRSVAPKFKNAWRVTNIETQKKFDDCKKTLGPKIEVQELWHGSRSENWWSIIGQGLVLRPTNAIINGKMFGYGLYFANKAAKSIGYLSTYGSRWAGGNSDSGFLSLYDVIYGKPYMINKDYYSYKGLNQLDYDKLQKACPGANSLHALKDKTGLREDEIIVYKEEQCTIKYLVEISA